MSVSRYSSLKPVKDEPVEMYQGVWKGIPVNFERVFRGYRFSDEECEALCQNEMIQVHGIERNGVKYSVIGSLKEDMFAGFSQEFKSVKFKPDRTISYDPDYSFADRQVCYADGRVIPPAKVPRVELTPEEKAMMEDFDPLKVDGETAELDAQMEAMLLAPALPLIVQVPSKTDLPQFVPVFSFLSDQELAILEQRAKASVE